MKTLLLLILACLLICRLGSPLPPLLQGISFSQAVYDDQQNLLRLTLSSDEKYRVYTPLEVISPVFLQATLLQEDQYFYLHPGINPVALVKAAWQTYIMRNRKLGASTITMQVARLRYGIHSKTIKGKIWQILKALQLEVFYSKKEILEAYLNLASYGGNIEGVGAASIIYLEKKPTQINLAEALRLSVVPQNPARRRPNLIHQNDLQKAYTALCERWMTQHPEDRVMQNLISLPTQLTKKNLPFHAPHFVESVLRTNRDRTIISTLDLPIQKLIEKITHQYIEQRKICGINNAALMLIDTRDMAVKALIGSGNYFDSSICGQVNGAKAKRSPGSTLKPFIYALAMDQGIIHPYTVLKDAPSSFGGYNPENFEKDFLGPIKAKDALILSRNIPAIHLANQLKTPTLHQFLQQANTRYLKPEQDYGLSIALGSAEMTMEELVQLYAMLANQGVWKPLRTCGAPTAASQRLLSPEASFLTLDMLRDTPRPYNTNTALAQQPPVYWKTGTSSGHRDAWSIGIFGPYVLAVWVGDFTDGSHTSFVGTSTAAPLFFAVIEAVSKQKGVLQEVVASTHQMNLAKVAVCEASGLLPNAFCPCTVDTWFIPGKSPIQKDTVHREIAINRQTGLRTNHVDENTQLAVYEFWPSDLLKIFAQAGIKRSSPPPFEQDGDKEIEHLPGSAPEITSPKNGFTYAIRINKPSPAISFTATADADVTMLYWFVNDNFIGCSERDQPLGWQAKSGTYSIRVVDNYGRTNMRDLVVTIVE